MYVQNITLLLQRQNTFSTNCELAGTYYTTITTAALLMLQSLHFRSHWYFTNICSRPRIFDLMLLICSFQFTPAFQSFRRRDWFSNFSFNFQSKNIFIRWPV